VAHALAPGDDQQRPEALDWAGAFGQGVFDAESVEDVGGVDVRDGEFPVSWPGKRSKRWPAAL